LLVVWKVLPVIIIFVFVSTSDDFQVNTHDRRDCRC
jgi:hypothetical protein